MKALTITNESVTREDLLELAHRIPGAWVGIRIAAVLLFLEGWKTTRIAELFDISRWSMVKWIHRVNEEGFSGIPTKKRYGHVVSPGMYKENWKKHWKKIPQNLGLREIGGMG